MSIQFEPHVRAKPVRWPYYETVSSSYQPLPLDLPSPDWLGTERYEFVRCLGKGGMGVVYEARDRETGQTLALKTLLKATPNALYLFKREFRGLADVDHPNLVRLHEFAMSSSDRVFFTMELVRGTDFISYVQGATAHGLSWRRELSTRPTSSGRRTAPCDSEHPRPSDRPNGDGSGSPFDLGYKRPQRANLDRLRPALEQLCDGVMALHAARKLHRDIKPSNVLVTLEGRVVLLDFGVVADLSRAAVDQLREEEQMVGTATYMAPEQAFEEPTTACDWYSVGVMLYESMVGRPPFTGSVTDVLTRKATVDPQPPSELVEGIPADLDALCAALLQREPGSRPSGSEVLQRLGVTRASPERAASSWALRVTETAAAAGLVGREAHLRALGDAFDVACTQGMVTLRIGGRAGVGKSALVEWFVADVVERHNAVVLRGRAYEREAMPYKAIDSIVDSLTRYLICLDDEEIASVLPPDAWTIARLFPVLRRVPAIETMPGEPIVDPQRARRRAFRALRDLLGSLAQRRPLVLFIDDVHWGDTDSAALLLELARPPDAPPLASCDDLSR
jgi:eukaryotic-like serine/threonine-protein kinase